MCFAWKKGSPQGGMLDFTGDVTESIEEAVKKLKITVQCNKGFHMSCTNIIDLSCTDDLDGFIGPDKYWPKKEIQIVDLGNESRLVNLPNKSTIVDQSNGRLQEILNFADKNDLWNDFIEVLERLCWNRPNEIIAFVYADFAPLSLTFGRYHRDKYVLAHEHNQIESAYAGNGGIIYHGPHDNGGDGSAPTFSVSLNPDSNPHWRIHT